ncbi:hypothetical protein B0H63DRAFT_526204 [Podospora didyma]|uniref:Uncharacterized protein n=1 Tax=Podospora didyma TaxID=330526 RepID=A0AAE0N9Z5_9PEZI|nr:hypothetical protein B0H63DRAFT_526204 [Podospora didyma]
MKQSKLAPQPPQRYGPVPIEPVPIELREQQRNLERAIANGPGPDAKGPLAAADFPFGLDSQFDGAGFEWLRFTGAAKTAWNDLDNAVVPVWKLRVGYDPTPPGRTTHDSGGTWCIYLLTLGMRAIRIEPIIPPVSSDNKGKEAAAALCNIPIVCTFYETVQDHEWNRLADLRDVAYNGSFRSVFTTIDANNGFRYQCESGGTGSGWALDQLRNLYPSSKDQQPPKVAARNCWFGKQPKPFAPEAAAATAVATLESGPLEKRNYWPRNKERVT